MTVAEIKLDAMEIATFHSRLTDIERQPDRYEHPNQKFTKSNLIYIDYQNKPWVKRSVWHQITHQGSFELIRNYPNAIPRVNILVDEQEQRVYKWGSSYDWTDDDMLAVMRMNLSIETEKILAVREAYKQKLNRLIAYGEPSVKMPGFINHPDVLKSEAPFDLDSTATPMQMLAVLKDTVNAIVQVTNEVEVPDTLLLPLSRYLNITSQLIYSPDGLIARTVAEHFLETNPYIQNIEPLTELESRHLAANGLGNNPVIIAYCRDRSKVQAKVLQPLTYKEPKREGIDGWVKPVVFKFGGVQFKRPFSCHVVSLPNAA